MTAVFLLMVCAISPLMFAGSVWLTRAGPKRASAALAACVAAAVFSVGWDALAARMGWWRYPSSGDLLETMTVSITVAFLFGGAAGLAGWRMMRAMGWTGAVAFFVAFVGVGLLRDNLLEINTSMFAIGPGPMPHVMGAVGYLSIALVVQITMLLMAGPPTRDTLRVH